jgi:hypothetical protein
VRGMVSSAPRDDKRSSPHSYTNRFAQIKENRKCEGCRGLVHMHKTRDKPPNRRRFQISAPVLNRPSGVEAP